MSYAQPPPVGKMNKYHVDIYSYSPTIGKNRTTGRRVEANSVKEAIQKVTKMGFSEDDIIGVWEKVAWLEKDLHILEYDR